MVSEIRHYAVGTCAEIRKSHANQYIQPEISDMADNVTRVGSVGASQISIGRFTYGIENLSIKQWGEGAALNIGAFCSIASDVTIFLGGNHRTDWISTFPFGHIYQDELGGQHIKGHPATNGDVNIGNDVWIGADVTIMSGVTVGSGAVLSANAHVVKDVLPYEVVGGNPAQLLRKRFEGEMIDLLMELKWWDLPQDAIVEMSGDLCSQPNKDLLAKLIEKYRA